MFLRPVFRRGNHNDKCVNGVGTAERKTNRKHTIVRKSYTRSYANTRTISRAHAFTLDGYGYCCSFKSVRHVFVRLFLQSNKVITTISAVASKRLRRKHFSTVPFDDDASVEYDFIFNRIDVTKTRQKKNYNNCTRFRIEIKGQNGICRNPLRDCCSWYVRRQTRCYVETFNQRSECWRNNENPKNHKTDVVLFDL